MAYVDMDTLTITTTGATSETQYTASVTGGLIGLILDQTAGSTFPSTGKVSVTAEKSGQEILTSGHALTVLHKELYPTTIVTGTTGGVLATVGYRIYGFNNERLAVTLIHGTTTIHTLTMKYLIDGEITKTA